MFASRDRCSGAGGLIEVAFTDRYGGVSPPPYDSLNLGGAPADRPGVRENFELLARGFGVEAFARMRQVHGRDAVVVTSADEAPTCDVLVSATPEVALCVRVADCVPLVLADADRGVVGVAHVGRLGVVAGTATAAVAAMREAGATAVDVWVGPHICGGCYEVPPDMRAAVAAQVPVAYACTTWGTPALDIGAAVASQLEAAGCRVHLRARCTRESPDLFSYRRDGRQSGRLAGLVVRRGRDDG